MMDATSLGYWCKINKILWSEWNTHRVRFVAGRIDIGTKFGTFGLREKQKTPEMVIIMETIVVTFNDE